MLKSKVALFVLLLVPALSSLGRAYDGGGSDTGGGGGDIIVYCTPSADNPYDGYYWLEGFRVDLGDWRRELNAKQLIKLLPANCSPVSEGR